MTRGSPAAPSTGLEALVLVEQSRRTFAQAILQSLESAFGLHAGIILDDPSWGLTKNGARGARTFPVGAFGAIAVPGPADARVLAARIRSYGHCQTETWTAMPWERFEIVLPR